MNHTNYHTNYTEYYGTWYVINPKEYQKFIRNIHRKYPNRICLPCYPETWIMVIDGRLSVMARYDFETPAIRFHNNEHYTMASWTNLENFIDLLSDDIKDEFLFNLDLFTDY